MAGENSQKPPIKSNEKPDADLIDTDGDGIPDIYDSEPDNPANTEFERKIQDSRHWIDTDGDGVPDFYDKDPNTPAINELERSLQDNRVNWKNISPDIHRQYDIRICSRCQTPTPAKNIVFYNDMKICINCWNILRHEVLEKRISLIQSKEKEYLQHQRLKVISKLPPNISHSIPPINKKNQNVRKQIIEENVIYPEHEFDVTTIDITRAIFNKLFQNAKTLQKYLPSQIKITNKNFKSGEHSESGKIIFEIPNVKLEWELKLDITDKKATYNAILSGKADQEFINQLHLTLAEIFHVEQRMMKDKLGWIDAYLACYELVEAENLIQDIAANMPSNIKHLLKLKIEEVKNANSEGRPLVDFVICPFCSSSHKNSNEFIQHLEKDHPSSNK